MVQGRRSERIARDERLRLRVDFLRCYRQGKRRQAASALVYYFPNGLAHPRLGITASRKVGQAFERHRLKRRIREIYRRSAARWELPAVDVVVHLKPEAKGVAFAALSEELVRLLGMIVRSGANDNRARASSPRGHQA
jgi:ribonuclease P protein component